MRTRLALTCALLTTTVTATAPLPAPLSGTPAAPPAVVAPVEPAAVPAGELPYEWVSSDAQWVAHIDVRAALASEMAQMIDTTDWDDEEATRELRDRLGLEIKRDIHAVTVYGQEDDEDSLVVLVQGDERLDEARQRLMGLLRHGRVEHDGQAVDRWVADDGDDPFYTYLAKHSDSSERVLVLAVNAPGVVRGLRTLQGRAPHLDAGARAALAPSPGAFVTVVAHEGFSELADLDPTSRVAELVQSVVLEVGEHDASLFARLSVGARNEFDAQQIGSVLQGAASLFSLVAQNEPEAEPLIPIMRNLQIRTEGNRVTVRIQHDSRELMSLLEGELGHRRQMSEVDEMRRRPETVEAVAEEEDGWY